MHGYVGEFAAEDRQRLVIATKYTLFTRRDHPNAAGSHRKNMVESLEASLRRLRTGYVDVYFVRAWYRLTPIEEVMRGPEQHHRLRQDGERSDR